MKTFPHRLSSILVVDDNPKNLQLLGNYLQEEGFKYVEFALNGASALRWIDQKDFDLILLDIMMPGMDGYEVCKIIKNNINKQEIPVIFLTAKVDTESLIKAFNLGAVDYITKPFNQKELLARVKTHIEIKKSREEIKNHLKDIEYKNKLNADSINYAKSIQTALFKTFRNLSVYFPDHFSINLPKDVVSGDFFWTGKIDDKFLLGVFDCTGHGVPGAFISLLFSVFLNETINNKRIHEPHQILNRLREEVIVSLAQKGNVLEINDGMDAAIISYDTENEVIQFSGAFNKMFLIRDSKIHEYRGDRMPVAYIDTMEGFSLQEIKIRKNDVIYLFTDGYVDQFGGPDGKKLNLTYFKKILLDHYKKPLRTQKQILLKAFSDWKGDEDQVDDVTIVCVRI